MLKHSKYTRTRYEYTISDGDNVAFTIWFMERNPSLNKVYRSLQENIEDIRRTTGIHDITWNGDKTMTAGTFTGKFTGRTLLEARGYKSDRRSLE